MAAHGNNLDPEARYTPTNLSHPDRVAMMRQRDEIHRLPETDFEPPSRSANCLINHPNATTATPPLTRET